MRESVLGCSRFTDGFFERSNRLAEICAASAAAHGVEALTGNLIREYPDWNFCCVLTRGGWYRMGGVVDADYRRISDNITQWAERESAGDLDELVMRYMDAGFFATRLTGKTHYFTAPTGNDPGDFVQLEIEELQEVLDHRLLDRDWYPDSIDELIDPLDYPRLEPEPIGEPYYLLRRLTPVSSLLESGDDSTRRHNLHRFFHDWQASSANDGEHLCHHWVLALQQYLDSDSEYRLSARPVSTYAGQLPDLPAGESLRGAELAKAIHTYDRRIGFPFAWFFMMLSCRSANYTLAQAVLRDQMGAYDYLASRDLKVLRDWEERPYSV